MATMDTEETKAWLKRLDVVGRAQARYLWILLLVGLFFLAVHFQVMRAGDGGANTVTVPLVDLELSALPLWASAPAVLFYLLLVILGSLRAYRTAEEAVGVAGFGQGEAYDLNPNALDFAAYTTDDSWRWLKQLLLFKYPLVLSVFWFEGAWLLAEVFAWHGSLPFKWIFVAVGIALFVPATWKIGRYWSRNAKRAREAPKAPRANAA